MGEEGGPRIAIIGSSGSGKSTLARRLGLRLGVSVVELDALNWDPGWRDLSKEDPELFRRRIEAATAGERWVADGNYSRIAREPILARATDLIWLDYPRPLIMRQVIVRSFLRAISGKELWPGTGNREMFSRWLDKDHPIRWAWDTYRPASKARDALFQGLADGPIRLHRPRTHRQTDALVERLAAEASSSLPRQERDRV